MACPLEGLGINPEYVGYVNCCHDVMSELWTKHQPRRSQSDASRISKGTSDIRYGAPLDYAPSPAVSVVGSMQADDWDWPIRNRKVMYPIAL